MYRTARLTVWGRRHLIEEAARIGVSQAARNMGVSRNTVYRWRRRTDELGDRGCRPHHSPRRTSFEREAALLAARWEWRWGPDRIGPMTGIPRRTAYRILRRFRAHRLRELFPQQRPQRGTFVATEPGEVVQIDIKSIGRLSGRPRHNALGQGKASRELDRGAGLEHVHVAIDAARVVGAISRSGAGSVPQTARPSSATPCRPSTRWASGSDASSPITAPDTRRSSPQPVSRPGCAGRAPSRTTPGPTVAPSDSSARCSRSACMKRTWTAPKSVDTSWPAGSLSTIASVRTPHLVDSAPSAG